MRLVSIARHYIWIAPLVLGFVFIAPAVFYSAQVANHYEELVNRERTQEKGATS